MIRRAFLPLLLVLLASLEAHAENLPETAAGIPAGSPRVVEADREALDEIVRQHRVVTTPEPPGAARYLRDLGSAFVEWLAVSWPGLAGFFETGTRWFAQAVFLLALALLVAFLFHLVRHAYVRQRAVVPPVVPLEAPAGETGEGRPREAWADELRRRLAAGDVAAACEALWWWLARTLLRGPVEASWTSRELLAQAGRRDLAPAVGRLDRMIYGAAAPAADDVRRLWRDLEEDVA